MSRTIALLLLATGAAALNADFSDKEWKERPVTKVVNLLKDMQAQLEKEAAQDEELYDQMVCWCETNEKEKTSNIETENQMITDLTAAIEESAAKHAQLSVEIDGAKKEIETATAALAEATALREKEYAEFNADEKDAIASITNLKGAVTTLSKHHGGSALVQRETLTQLTTMLRRNMKTRPEFMAQAVAPRQQRVLMSLLQKPNGMLSLLQTKPALLQAKAPASGEIFGILNQMKESFETNLEQSKKDEQEAVASYAALKSAKETEIKAAQDKVFNKEAEMAEAIKKNAESKEQLDNTRVALEADTGFLSQIKQHCADLDRQWEIRSKMRSEEIAAVSETVSFLTDDDARDLFSKSLGFIQLRANAQRESVEHRRAVQFLAEAGKRLHSPRIAYLATRARFDPFGGLRDSIDSMTGALGKEKEDEIHHKDDCVTDFNENEKQTTERDGHKTDVEQEINDLDSEIEHLQADEKRLLAEIAETQVEMKKASEEREKANRDFQAQVADQRATQEILKKAMERLGAFYNKAALAQQSAPLGAALEKIPGGFGEYKKAGGGGAMALIENIIADSAEAEKDAMQAEQEEQSAYEAFIKDSNEEIKAKQTGLTNDKENEAKDKIQESHDETDKRGTIQDLLNLGSVNGALHTSCDFTLDNFETRQTAREGEIEALKQAKAIFSGAGFGR